MPLGGRLPAVPNGAGIVKRLKWAIPILDGIMQQPVSTNRVQVVFVPTAQVIAVPRHEALEERSLPADDPAVHVFEQLMLAVCQPVMQAPRMRDVGEIAVQEFSGSAQRVPRIQIVLEIRIVQPAMKAD